MKEIAVNRQARFEYFVEDTYEAGIVLEGSEVKSIRRGGVNLRDSFALVENGEVWLKNAHISPYEKSSAFNTHDAKRDRKLLLNRAEINKIVGKVKQKGYTLVPLKMYFRESLVKLELGLCRGKQTFDKRKSIAERDQKRSVERQLKELKS
jgi:ssrA-binding protein